MESNLLFVVYSNVGKKLSSFPINFVFKSLFCSRIVYNFFEIDVRAVQKPTFLIINLYKKKKKYPNNKMLINITSDGFQVGM